MNKRTSYIKPFSKAALPFDSSLPPELISPVVLDTVDLGTIDAFQYSDAPTTSQTSNTSFKQKLKNFWAKTTSQAKTLLKMPITYVIIIGIAIITYVLTKKRY